MYNSVSDFVGDMIDVSLSESETVSVLLAELSGFEESIVVSLECKDEEVITGGILD